MLGLMNSPSECVDFYAQPKGDHNCSRVLGEPKKKSTVSYTDDGRRMINGKVEAMKEPHEMWSNLLIRSAARQVDGNNGSILHRCVNDPVKVTSSNSAMIKPTLLHMTIFSKRNSMTVVDYLGSTNVVLTDEIVADKLEGEDEMAVKEAEEKEEAYSEPKAGKDDDDEQQ